MINIELFCPCSRRASYLQVPSAEDALIQNQRLLDKIRFCELHIRIPAYAY